MTWDDTRGDGALMSDLQTARRADLRQWRSGVRSWRLRFCCRCRLPIWPGVRHHHVVMGDGRERRIHYARCPGDAGDTLPEYGPAERGIAALEWLMMAGAWAFALAVVGALCMALGYEW